MHIKYAYHMLQYTVNAVHVPHVHVATHDIHVVHVSCIIMQIKNRKLYNIPHPGT